jgi:NADPH oxidase
VCVCVCSLSAHDDEGELYYFNEALGESSWDFPSAAIKIDSVKVHMKPRLDSDAKSSAPMLPSIMDTSKRSSTFVPKQSKKKTDYEYQPPAPYKPPEDNTKPITKFGLWARSMALLSVLYMALFGTCVLILWFTNSTRYGFYNYLVAIYCLTVGAIVWGYEFFWGYVRNQGGFPTRALVYFLAAFFFFLSEFTIIMGICFVFIALANLMAWVNKEEYGRYEYSFGFGKRKTEIESLFGSGFCAKLKRRIIVDMKKNELGETVFLLAFISLNAYLFFTSVVFWTNKVNEIREETPEDAISGYGPYAKGFGNLLDLNASIIVIPMCRTFLRALYDNTTASQTKASKCCRKVLRFCPIHHNIEFHRFLAYCVFLASMGHTLFHALNLAARPDQTLALFGVWPWVSGFAIWLSMFFIFSASEREVKTQHFEIFWLNHHFFIAFFLITLSHGNGYLNPNFWRWFIGPGTLYVIERLLRTYRAHRKAVVLRAVMMQDGVFSLEFSKRGVFKAGYREGQYLYLNCPAVSKYEWHPFTISSAPENETVTVHIKTYDPGSWTYRTRDIFREMGKPGAPVIELTSFDAKGKRMPGKRYRPDGSALMRIDGPHSAPTQHVGEYRCVMVCGAGIGVTPVASTLKSIVFHTWRKSFGVAYPNNAYFFWACKWAFVDQFRWMILLMKEAQDEVCHLRHTNSDMKDKKFQIHVYVTSVPKNCPQPKPAPAPDSADGVSYWGMSHDQDENNSDGKQAGHVKRHGANFTAQALYKAMKYPVEKHQQLGDIHIWNGRPKWGPRFEEVSNNHPDCNIACCFCGPPVIANALKVMTYETNRKRSRKVIRFYSENF